ncbi:hypothetical protein [Halocatena salina]|uniref:Uncharacterized protein n=1 Tax=Halocatena salina TaxID=2934340 RepID=A0A8U0A8Q7_9EURY|nr:hypothetical protein [Halocatena salina]UPM45344.1 hypothetical protein MW046_18915 [Halocatena salina]
MPSYATLSLSRTVLTIPECRSDRIDGQEQPLKQSIANLLDDMNHLQILQPPVTVVIDITT